MTEKASVSANYLHYKISPLLEDISLTLRYREAPRNTVMIYESSAIRIKLKFIFSFFYEGKIMNCKERGLFHTSYLRDLWIIMSPEKNSQRGFHERSVHN